MNLRFPEDVSGWLHPYEGLALFRLAMGKHCLEIGSYQGKSTVCLAQSAESVVSIDWHRGDPQAGHSHTLPAFFANLEGYGVLDKVRVLVGRAADIGPLLVPEQFDFAFVDGGHDADNVRTDLSLCSRLVRPGGVIALHDWPQVAEFAAPLVGMENLLGSADTLYWFRKP